MTALEANDRVKKLTLTTVALCVAASVLLMGCEKARLDEEVRQLCAKDGGIKVYEMVELPKNEFNEFGQVSFYQAAPGSVLLNDYELIKNEHIYHPGNPRMWRTYFAIKRKNDEKILGESVGYTRFGDGFEGPFHPSSFSCPDQFGEVSLLQRVFPNKTLISR